MTTGPETSVANSGIGSVTTHTTTGRRANPLPYQKTKTHTPPKKDQNPSNRSRSIPHVRGPLPIPPRAAPPSCLRHETLTMEIIGARALLCPTTITLYPPRHLLAAAMVARGGNNSGSGAATAARGNNNSGGEGALVDRRVQASARRWGERCRETPEARGLHSGLRWPLPLPGFVSGRGQLRVPPRLARRWP